MSLISQDEFVGLDGVVHLSAGGETPMLRSHSEAFGRFTVDKACGEEARARQARVVEDTREQCAKLFSVDAQDLTFLSTASEGINIVVYGLDWQKGDNVVIADVEFSSGIFPWTLLQDRGVEVRIVRHRDWQISLEDIADQIDSRTRVVLMSHVSMFTGQRLPLAELSNLVRSHGAALVLDATHSAGVVPVEAKYADVMVTSCYKWLLGVHGTAVFYWNRDRFPELKTPFLGWNSVSRSGGWKDPTSLELHEDAHRFMPGNPAFLSLYILNNALARTAPISLNRIEQHVLSLTGYLRMSLESQGWEIMTPSNPEDRAGNVCIMSDRVDEIARALRERNILVWGTYAGDERLRISTHLYNSMDDVEACVEALAKASA